MKRTTICLLIFTAVFASLLTAHFTSNVSAMEPTRPQPTSSDAATEDNARAVAATSGRTWYLDNVRFDSGAYATGSFHYDQTVGRLGTFSDIDVQVHNPDGTVNNYQIVNTFSGGNERYVSFVAAQGGDLTGVPYLALTPAMSMTLFGGYIDILPGPQDLSYQGVCSRADCGPASEPYEEVLPGARIMAGPQKWYVQDVVFDSGATASGSFSFDPAAGRFGVYSDIDVQVFNPDGTVNDYQIVNEYSGGNARYISFVAASGGDQTGVPYLAMTPAISMTHLGGVIDLLPGPGDLSYQGVCSQANCGPASEPYEEILSGRIVSNPGPQTWHLEGLRTDGGATVTGSYKFDPTGGRFGNYTDIDIQMNNVDQTVYDFQIVNPFSGGNDKYLSLVAAPGGDLTGAPFLALTPAMSMTNISGPINISPGPQALSYFGFCARADCGPADGPYQEVISGRITRFVVPPTIVTGATVSVPENQTSVMDVNSTDNLDSEGNGLVYRFSGGADQFLLNIDASTGVVSFINPPDYENPADAGRNNVYNAQVTVTDLGGRTDAQDLVITIIDSQTWRLDGVQLSNGQTVAGTFDYIAAENRYLHMDITVNDGAGTTFNVLNPGVNTTGETLSLVNQLVGDLTGRSTLRFTFASPLPAAGGTIDIRTAIPIAGTVSTLATCANIDCSTYTTPLESMTGQVTTLPDEIAPTSNPTFDPPANAAGWHNADVTITWNWADDIWGIGIDPANCELTATLAGEGSFARVGQCADLAGNPGVQGSGSVQIDKTAPASIPTFDPPANAAGWHNADVTITWNWTEAISGIDPENCVLTNTLTSEGSSAVVGQCSDIASNPGLQGSGSVQIDKTAPETIITSNPAAISTNVNATFIFTGTDALSSVAGFECTLEDGTLGINSPCTSPQNYTTLDNGTYTFTVRAIDVAGNADQSPVSFTWEVDAPDTTAPTASPSFSPPANGAGWHNTDVTVNFNWADNAGGSGINANACATTTGVSGEGVDIGYGGGCQDLSGNVGEITGFLSIDKTAPETSLESTPPVTNTGNITFTFSGSDALSGVNGFTCSLDNGQFGTAGPCNSPYAVSGLASGTYTFSVAAVDTAGNADPTPTMHTFNVTGESSPTAVNVAQTGAQLGSWSPLMTVWAALATVSSCWLFCRQRLYR